jgi:hypothetical protein
MPLTIYIDRASGLNYPALFENRRINDVYNAMQKWTNKTNGAVRFQEVNDTSSDIIVQWVSATYETPGKTWKVLGEVVPNFRKTYINITLSPYDCQNVYTMLHEFGHALNLAHSEKYYFLENGIKKNDIMYFYSTCDEPDISPDEASTLIEFYKGM